MRNLRNWIANHKAAIFFGVILFYLYFRGIGDHGLIDNLEGINASIAVHMLGGENYFVPKIGKIFAAGSTMGTWWLMAIAVKIFGLVEFSVRFWPALSGLGTILISSMLVKSDDDELESESENNSRCSWLAASICAGMTINFAVSQIASSHAIFSFLMSLSMLGIIRSQKDNDWLMLAHASTALGLIAHGPAGLFMPFIAVAVYCVLTDDMELLKNFFTWPFGIVINLVLSGLYFAAMMIFNPQIIFFMFCQNHGYTYGGILGAIIFLFASFAPFHGFLIQALIEIFPRRYPAEKSDELFMLIWSVTFAAYAIFSGDILAVSAAAPALSAILAVRLDLWLRGKMLPVCYAVLFNMAILVPVYFILLPLTMNYFPVIKNSLLSLIPYEIMLFIFIFACWYYTKTRQIEKWVRNVPAAALLCLMPAAGIFNLTADLYSVKDIGMKLRETIQTDDIVMQYGVNHPSVYFYSFRNSLIINAPLTPGLTERNYAADVDVINNLWARRNRVFLIIPQSRLSEAKLPNKNVFTLDESNGILLMTNK